MSVYRSALGRSIDMASLAAKNEKVRAVGNMQVNARGDTIDGMGRIIKPATEKVNERYSRTVGNRSAQPVKRTTQAPIPAKPVVKEQLTDIERELEDSFEDDIEIEKIKAQELKSK
jgi:hypothetical protein